MFGIKQSLSQFFSRFKFFGRHENLNAVFLVINFLSLIAGISYSSTLLLYEGKSPVNILKFLFFFIFIQIFILLFALIASALKKDLPFTQTLSKVAVFLFSSLGGNADLIEKQDLKKQVIVNGVLFSFGGLLALLGKVFFSDIVFGWSTTLNIGHGYLKNLTDVLSFPWSFFEKGVPTEELIKKSEYFRVNYKFYLGDTESLNEIKMLGSWWIFLSLCIVFYGVIPRCLLFFVYSGKSKLRKTVNFEKQHFENPGIDEIFNLNEDETLLFYSILHKILLGDIEAERKEDLIYAKKNWLKKWLSQIERFEGKEVLTEKEIYQYAQNLVKNPTAKLFVFFTEISIFTPYYPLAEGEQFIKYNERLILERTKKYVKWFGAKPQKLDDFHEKFSENLKEARKGFSFKAFLGIVSVAALAFLATGGAAAPLLGGVMAKALGVVGVAAKAMGFVLLGSGVLILSGFEKSGTKILIGCGSLFGGVRGTIDKVIYKEYLKSDEALYRDLKKLQTYVQLRFFDMDYFVTEREKLRGIILQIKKDVSSGPQKSKSTIHLIEGIESSL